MPPPSRNLSSAISDTLARARRIGRLAVAAALLGTALLVAAGLSERSGAAYAAGCLGAAMLLGAIAVMYTKDVKALEAAQRRLDEEREMLDALQSIGLQLTRLASDLQVLAAQNADGISDVMLSVRAIRERFPRLARFATDERLDAAEDLATQVMGTTARSARLLESVENALTTVDPVAMRRCSAELESMKADFKIGSPARGPTPLQGSESQTVEDV